MKNDRQYLVKIFDINFLDTGFPCCPPDLQEFITTRYHQWYTMNPKFWAILWSTDENQEIVMELLRAGCKLEVADLGRQTKIFNLFFENLVVRNLALLLSIFLFIDVDACHFRYELFLD